MRPLVKQRSSIGPALGGIPSSNESLSAARGVSAENLVYISCPQLNTVIANWLENKRQQAMEADSHAMDTLRRRAGVMGFRAGMLCYLLENRKFTKTVASFAEWVAEYVFRNQMELWGEQMEQELSGALEVLSGERGSVASLLLFPPKSAYFYLKWHISPPKLAYIKNFSYLCTQIWCKDERRPAY